MGAGVLEVPPDIPGVVRMHTDLGDMEPFQLEEGLLGAQLRIPEEDMASGGSLWVVVQPAPSPLASGA